MFRAARLGPWIAGASTALAGRSRSVHTLSFVSWSFSLFSLLPCRFRFALYPGIARRHRQLYACSNSLYTCADDGFATRPGSFSLRNRSCDSSSRRPLVSLSLALFPPFPFSDLSPFLSHIYTYTRCIYAYMRALFPSLSRLFYLPACLPARPRLTGARILASLPSFSSLHPFYLVVLVLLSHTTSAKQQIPRPSNYPEVGSFARPFLDLNVRAPTSFTAPRTTAAAASTASTAAVGRRLEIDGPVALRGTLVRANSPRWWIE